MVASGFLSRGHHFAPWFAQFTAVSDQKVCSRFFCAACIVIHSWCFHIILLVSVSIVNCIYEAVDACFLFAPLQVTCLLIPRAFLAKINDGAVLEQLRETQESAYVSELEMAEKFIAQSRWERSRRQIYDETLSKLKGKHA